MWFLFVASLFYINCNGNKTQPFWIETVHVVISNHLDVGFTNFSIDVINEYFDVYFDEAIQTGIQLKSNQLTYKWMTHSYLISLYFDCPPWPGLHCPTKTKQNYVYNEGIVPGYIYWYSWPFNSELSGYSDTSLIEFGLKLSKDLSIKYPSNPLTNSLTYTISQRDVPGMTRSMIPLLVKNNITAISIGVNTASAPPDVPSIFKWFDNKSNTSIIGMMHGGGFGGLSVSDAVVIDNFNDALVMAWKPDNSGPPLYNDVIDYYNITSNNFPNATKVFASTFDNFINALYAKPDILSKLPVHDKEMGDTWGYGISSDPYKVSCSREAARQRYKCLYEDDECTCTLNDYAMYNFSRLLLKAYEHTWGGSICQFLDAADIDGYYYYWSNEEFYKAMTINDTYKNNSLYMLKETWVEQRNVSLKYPINALLYSNNSDCIDLYHNISNQCSELLNPVSPLDKYNKNDWILINNASKTFVVESLYNKHEYEIKFDDAGSGGIIELFDLNTGINYASTVNESILGEIIYQTITDLDLENYVKMYGDQDYYYCDMSKQRLDEFANPNHTYNFIKFNKLYQSSKPNKNEFIVQMDFAELQNNLETKYGVPQYFYYYISFNSNKSTFSFDVYWIHKTVTRMAEIIYFKFKPFKCLNWRVDKLDEYIDINNIMINGTMHVHPINKNVTCSINEKHDVIISSKDVSLAAFKPEYKNKSSVWYNQFTPLATPWLNASETEGTAFILFDNIWGTNYPSWYPFNPLEVNSSFRFDIILN